MAIFSCALTQGVYFLKKKFKANIYCTEIARNTIKEDWIY